MIQIDDFHTLLTRFNLKGNFDLFLRYFIYTISFEQSERLKYFSSIYHLERGKRQKAKPTTLRDVGSGYLKIGQFFDLLDLL